MWVLLEEDILYSLNILREKQVSVESVGILARKMSYEPKGGGGRAKGFTSHAIHSPTGYFMSAVAE